MHEFFPEWNEGFKARVTVRHLLDHTSGLDPGGSPETAYATDDFLCHALDAGIETEPGTVIFYNNTATNLLAGIIGKVRMLRGRAAAVRFLPTSAACDLRLIRDRVPDNAGVQG